MKEKGLIIFVRNLIPGRVKTRLSSKVGNQKALEIYGELLSLTQNWANQIEAEKYIFYDGFIEENDMWSEETYHKKLQSGKDLGERMKNAFQEILTDCMKVILVGSDCPAMTEEICAQAFDLLETSDTVIGPAEDGGYYLLGMKSAKLSLFQEIDWSTNAVFSQTVAKMKTEGLTFRKLRRLPDIDTYEDWVMFGDLLGKGSQKG